MSWHSEYEIDGLCICILSVWATTNCAEKRVCIKWKNAMAKYAVVGRYEMSCYFSKSRLTEGGCTEIMGTRD